MTKFKIGDEVMFYNNDAVKFVITCIHKDGSLAGIGRDGIAFVDKNPEKWVKTGKFFPEAVEFINALNDGEKKDCDKNTILEEICRFQDWNGIEYILTGIWNERNLAFRDWLSKLITNN